MSAAEPVAQEAGQAGHPETESGPIRITAFVIGQVQGVGFRWWTRATALELGLAGSATNLSDGRVQVIAEGARDSVAALLAAVRGGSAPGTVTQVIEQIGDPRGERGFIER